MKSVCLQSFFILFCGCLPLAATAQIIVKKLDKVVEQDAARPEPYDSLKPMVFKENFKENFKFVGQKLYLHTSRKYQARMLCMKASIIPAAIDKSGRFDERNSYLKDINNVATCVYKPINTSLLDYNTGLQAELISDSTRVCGKYYTITNLYKLAQADSISARMRKALGKISGEKTTSFGNKTTFIDDHVDRNYYSEVGFIMLKTDSGDSIFVHGIGEPFVEVAYFAKQQQLFNRQKFLVLIPDYAREDSVTVDDYRTSKQIALRNHDEFTCEVALLEGVAGISYIFTNNRGETLMTDKLARGYPEDEFSLTFISTVRSQKTLKTINVTLKINYLNKVAETKLARAQALALRQQREAKIAVETQNRARKYLQECTAKFGSELGGLVAKGIVRIGMTQEMCLVSWGKPFDKAKTTVPNAVYETFYYSWRRTLHFTNGLLARISAEPLAFS